MNVYYGTAIPAIRYHVTMRIQEEIPTRAGSNRTLVTILSYLGSDYIHVKNFNEQMFITSQNTN
jgi:hypothetical protein